MISVGGHQRNPKIKQITVQTKTLQSSCCPCPGLASVPGPFKSSLSLRGCSKFPLPSAGGWGEGVPCLSKNNGASPTCSTWQLPTHGWPSPSSFQPSNRQPAPASLPRPSPLTRRRESTRNLFTTSETPQSCPSLNPGIFHSDNPLTPTLLPRTANKCTIITVQLTSPKNAGQYQDSH